MNLCRGILHCGLSVPAAEPGDSDGGCVWRGEHTGDSHISESRWINIPRDVGVGVGLTREVGEGRCRLRSALILAHSSAAQPLPITSSHNYSVCVVVAGSVALRRIDGSAGSSSPRPLNPSHPSRLPCPAWEENLLLGCPFYIQRDL